MPAAISTVEAPSIHHSALPVKKWTRDECARLQETGLLDLERIELLEGQLVERMGKNIRHSLAVAAVAAWLHEIFRGAVLHEAAIDVAPEDNPTSAPEPDAILLRLPVKGRTGPPRPEEIRLLIEVSDSTLYYDLTVKAGLYARAGIPEYWVLDLNGRRLIVHREPLAGRYLSILGYAETEEVACLAAPDSPVAVASFL